MSTDAWRKATRSNNSGACVQILDRATTVSIGDSKYLRGGGDPASEPIITLTRPQWATFLASVATGATHTTTEPRIDIHPDGSARLTAADGTHLQFTALEWTTFTDAVLDGEFDDVAIGRAAS